MYTQTLQENWKMREAGGDWLEAKVPGTVYTDLLRNGKMEDPYWKDNENKALPLMEKDYEYETVFSWERSEAGERIWLQFMGLDTIADIYVNEQLVGSAKNMHRIWEYDVTEAIQAGENTLRVYFHSPLAYIRNSINAPPAAARTPWTVLYISGKLTVCLGGTGAHTFRMRASTGRYRCWR